MLQFTRRRRGRSCSSGGSDGSKNCEIDTCDRERGASSGAVVDLMRTTTGNSLEDSETCEKPTVLLLGEGVCTRFAWTVGLLFGLIILSESFVLFFRSAALYIIVPVWSLACLSLAFRWRQTMRLRKSKIVLDTRQDVAAMIYIISCTILVICFAFGVTVTLRNDFQDSEFVVIGPRSPSSMAILAYGNGHSAFSIRYRQFDALIEKESTVAAVPIDDVAILEDLSPSTKYEFQVMFQPGTIPGPQGSFRTLPQVGISSKTSIKFASTSCANRFETFGGVPLEGFSRISARDPDLDFLLFLGDFVYVDEPWSAGYGSDANRYDANYRAALGEAHAKHFFANVPSLFMTDDHEYINDYSEGNSTSMYQVATKSWQRHIGNANPDGYGPEKGLYFNFSAGASEFFILDTRSNRDEKSGVILGEWQLEDVLAWLLDTQAKNPRGFKFIVSPVSATRNSPTRNANWNCGCPNCIDLDDANAQGLQCPNERDRLLAFCATQNISGVVILSGDTHVPAVWELAKGAPGQGQILEFSASPLQGGALDLTVGDSSPDRKIFEKTRLAQAWMVLQVDTDASGKSELMVKIYGGGPSIIIRICCVFLMTCSAFYVGLYVLVPSAFKNKYAGISAVVIFIASFLTLTLTHSEMVVQRDFQQPIFQWAVRIE